MIKDLFCDYSRKLGNLPFFETNDDPPVNVDHGHAELVGLIEHLVSRGGVRRYILFLICEIVFFEERLGHLAVNASRSAINSDVWHSDYKIDLSLMVGQQFHDVKLT